MTPTLETARLLLRPLELADAEQIQQVFPQWEVVRYLTNTVPWPYPPDGALAFCRDHALPAVERGEQWIWTLRLKDDAERIIGLIHLMMSPLDNRGFWLDLRWHRRGLMTEACESSPTTGSTRSSSPCSVRRRPSPTLHLDASLRSRVCGWSTEERDYVSGRLPAEIWEITADEWNARPLRS